MDDKFELVKKYNIDVDVFVDEDGVTPNENSPTIVSLKSSFVYILQDR